MRGDFVTPELKEAEARLALGQGLSHAQGSALWREIQRCYQKISEDRQTRWDLRSRLDAALAEQKRLSDYIEKVERLRDWGG